MKSHGILFKAEMVQALLNTDGEQRPIDPTRPYKWQTRRIIDPQPTVAGGDVRVVNNGKDDLWFVGGQLIGKCPHGMPGDTLWVRETWATVNSYDHLKPSEIPHGGKRWPMVWYAADPGAAGLYQTGSEFLGKVRSPLFMPRWASRITLEITEVRVQRLQEISEADAQAEGAEKEFEINLATFTRDQHWDAARASTYRLGFKHLWDKINKERGHGWDTNPLVWCLSFRRVR